MERLSSRIFTTWTAFVCTPLCLRNLNRRVGADDACLVPASARVFSVHVSAQAECRVWRAQNCAQGGRPVRCGIYVGLTVGSSPKR